MADNSNSFQVEIITPDCIFFRGRATMIEFHTIVGEIGVYKNHIPLTTVLSPGVIRIRGEREAESSWHRQEQTQASEGNKSESMEDITVAVQSGFAEILHDKVTIFAEHAKWPEERISPKI